MQYPHIEQLLLQFREVGFSVSESLTRSLQIGHEYAAELNYVPATDVLLHGLFHSNNTVASLASELTDKPDQFTDILDGEIHRYRKQTFPPELTYHCSIGFPQYSVRRVTKNLKSMILIAPYMPL